MVVWLKLIEEMGNWFVKNLGYVAQASLHPLTKSSSLPVCQDSHSVSAKIHNIFVENMVSK